MNFSITTWPQIPRNVIVFTVRLLAPLIFCILFQKGSVVSAQTSTSPSSPLPVSLNQSAFVEFNNRILFTVYTNGTEDAQDRADLADLRLDQAWSKNIRNRGGDVDDTASVSERYNTPLIMMDGNPVIYVTAADANGAGVDNSQLAQTWADKINAGFAQKIKECQPEYLRWAIKQAVIIVGLGASVFIIIFYAGFRLKAKRLYPLYTAIVLFVALRVVSLFPAARSVLLDFSTGPLRPLFIAVVVAVPAAALARLWALSLHAFFPPLPEHISSQDLIRRTNLRRRTLAGVAEVTGASFIWFLALVSGMSWYGVNLTSLLTSAGLLGVALGLVAQDSIKDTLSGIYILADDRYGMGDIIHVGEYEGRVERFNLRMTQIRDSSGRLITLSNRSTTEVANLTARWAQVDFRIGVSYFDDVDHALEVLKSTVTALAAEWPERFLEEPDILGIESFNDLNITLRLTAKTPPGDQSVVAHELRRRVKVAFDRGKIAIINDQFKAAKPD